MATRLARLLVSAAAVQVAARLGQPKKPFMVKLTKHHDLDHDPKEADHGSGYFTGPVKFGSPAQELQMLFSTTIATFVIDVPKNCTGDDCHGRHQYSPQKSRTSVDVQRDGTPVDGWGRARAPAGAERETMMVNLATDNHGKGVSRAVFVKEDVCLGDRLSRTGTSPEAICSRTNVIVAEHELFPTMPNDGLIGLGPPRDNAFSLLRHMRLDGLEPMFGYFVDDEAHNAELTFGGVDPSRLDEGIQWLPIEPLNGDDNMYLVGIEEIRVAGVALEMCKDERPCHGLLDSGSPDITVDERAAPELLQIIKKEKEAAGGPTCMLPELELVLKGGLTLTLKVEDYAGPGCEPEIHTNNFGGQFASTNLITLGEPVLRRYYSVYNWEAKKVAFGRAKVERSCARLQKAGVSTDGLDCNGVITDDTIMLLELPDTEM